MAKDKKVNLVDIETFASRYKIKVETVKKNINQIVGAKKDGKDYIIPDSARYPYRIGNTSIKTRDDKRYVLLKATSENKFVDEKLIGLSKASFNTLIQELLNQNLLIENGSEDKNGANAYDTSSLADSLLRNGKRRAMVEIGKAVAEIGGKFAAQFVT